MDAVIGMTVTLISIAAISFLCFVIGTQFKPLLEGVTKSALEGDTDILE